MHNILTFRLSFYPPEEEETPKKLSHRQTQRLVKRKVKAENKEKILQKRDEKNKRRLEGIIAITILLYLWTIS